MALHPGDVLSRSAIYDQTMPRIQADDNARQHQQGSVSASHPRADHPQDRKFGDQISYPNTGPFGGVKDSRLSREFRPEGLTSYQVLQSMYLTPLTKHPKIHRTRQPRSRGGA